MKQCGVWLDSASARFQLVNKLISPTVFTFQVAFSNLTIGVSAKKILPHSGVRRSTTAGVRVRHGGVQPTTSAKRSGQAFETGRADSAGFALTTSLIYSLDRSPFSLLLVPGFVETCRGDMKQPAALRVQVLLAKGGGSGKGIGTLNST